MSMQITLTYQTQTINLQSGGCIVADGFYPQVAADLSSLITETIDVILTGSDATRLAKLRQINTWLSDLARRDYIPGVNGVFLNFAIDGDETAYRARVMNGVALLDSKMDRRWRHGTTRISITLVREPAWEATTWTQIPLTNDNGTDNTSGLRVYACDDLAGTTPNAHNFFVNIDGDDILGDIPGPVKIEMKPETAYLPSHLYVGCHDVNYYGFKTSRFEMEDWADTAGATADASCSGGEYNVAALPTSWGNVLYSQLDLNYYHHTGYFRFFLRLRTAAPAGTWLNLQLKIYGEVMGETTPVYLGSSKLVDLGILRLPPYEFYGFNNYTAYLYLRGYNPSGGNLEADVINAVGTIGWVQRSRSASGITGTNWYLVEQFGIDEASYLVDPESTPPDNALPYFSGISGNGIYLYPGTDHHLAFLTRFEDDTTITDSMLVKLWHRPRRLSL